MSVLRGHRDPHSCWAVSRLWGAFSEELPVGRQVRAGEELGGLHRRKQTGVWDGTSLAASWVSLHLARQVAGRSLSPGPGHRAG